VQWPIVLQISPVNGRLSVVPQARSCLSKVVHGRVELDGKLPEGSSVTVIAADDDAFEADLRPRRCYSMRSLSVSGVKRFR
jgi:hypothetical protein